jgi:hypothetical protein
MKQIAPLLRRIALLAGIAAMAALPINAHSTEHEVVKTITRLYSYTLTAPYDGDIIFQVDSPPTGCVAFWIDKNNAGAKNSYALLLSAYHTQALVRIVAEDTALWGGSGQPHCRVGAIALE